MRPRSVRLRAERVLLTLALLFVTAVAAAGRAEAAPWGTSGADYNGVLCRIGTTDVPMGAWTVNGTVTAFSTQDITGTGPAQQPAPVSGTPTTMTAGLAGYSQADIDSVAYLLVRYGGGSAAELAEVSADVAQVAGSGQTQATCLGQNGTSASRAAGRLSDARRFAGPYRVEVQAQSGVIPGGNADISVTVRSASGAATPGVQVALAAGAASTSATTGDDGVARTTVPVPANPATTVTATASVPNGLVYLNTTPPSVSLAPLTTITGTTTLRPVLHPKPAVTIDATGLVLAGGTVRPVADITGTFGYSGNGTTTLHGPVQPAGTASCSSVPDAALARAAVRWQDTFTFSGDAQYRSSATPELTPGCYVLQSAVTTTNSSPPERASSPLARLTVATLKLASAATAKAAAPGGLSLAITGTDAGAATVTSTVEARGPLPVRDTTCKGDFADAPVAGRSKATALNASGGQLKATVTVPEVRDSGCYSLVARNEVTLDGRTTIATDPAMSTAAILRPSIDVAAGAVSGEQGRPMPGTVQVSGTFGFPGSVAVGVAEAATIPITGCQDASFAARLEPRTTTKVATTTDAAYPFRTPAPVNNGCYTIVATFTLAANPAVTASSGRPNDGTVFLAGVSPDRGPGSVVQTTNEEGILRAIITYGVAALLILTGAAALFVRTFNRERGRGSDRPLFRWRPNRDDDGSDGGGTLLGRPMPGNQSRPLPGAR